MHCSPHSRFSCEIYRRRLPAMPIFWPALLKFPTSSISRNVSESLDISKALRVHNVLYNKARRNVPIIPCCMLPKNVWLTVMTSVSSPEVPISKIIHYCQSNLDYKILFCGNSTAHLVTRVIYELTPEAECCCCSQILMSVWFTEQYHSADHAQFLSL